jgi:hypothetical protein
LNITGKIINKTASNLGGRSRKETRGRRRERERHTDTEDKERERERQRDKRERLKPEGTERSHWIQT